MAKLPKDQAAAVNSQLVEEEDSHLVAAAEVTEAKEVAMEAVAAVNVMVTILGKDNRVTLITPMGVDLVVCGVAEEVDTETVPIRLPRPQQM